MREYITHVVFTTFTDVFSTRVNNMPKNSPCAKYHYLCTDGRVESTETNATWQRISLPDGAADEFQTGVYYDIVGVTAAVVCILLE